MKICPKPLLIVFIASWGLSCAYFNTFYNAQRYFREAEEDILEAEDKEKLSKKTIDALGKTIAKCNAVLEDYPESRWGDDALLLKGKAHYYRGEFSRAKTSLEKLIKEEIESPLRLDAELWVGSCKWKLGDTEGALRDLKNILRELKADSKLGSRRVQLAFGNKIVAEIYLETGEIDSALIYFGKSADYIKGADARSRLFFRIAELAFEKSRYEAAGEYYRKVIDIGGMPKNVEAAYLQVVKITRIQKRWDETAEEIQNLLSNEKFSDIHPQLHLELAKLYQMQSRLNDATNRFRVVTEEFPKTIASAEAYYQLGTISLEISKDYAAARKYFETVENEKKESMYTPSARLKIVEIDALLNAKAEIDRLEKSLDQLRSEPINISDKTGFSVDNGADTLSLVDSTETQEIDTMSIIIQLAENYYSLGELLAFHFDEPDSGIVVFKKLIDIAPSSPKRPQALFSLFHLYEQRGDSTSARDVAMQLVEEYPMTEYAQKAAALLGLDVQDDAEIILSEAEGFIEENPERALQLYKSILIHHPTSQYVPHALMAIGITYDYHLNTLDSSIAFYGRLMEEFPESEHAVSVRPRYNQLLGLQESLLDTLNVPDSLATMTDEN